MMPLCLTSLNSNPMLILHLLQTTCTFYWTILQVLALSVTTINTTSALGQVIQSQPKQYLIIRGTIQYINDEEQYIGSAYFNTTSMILFHMVCNNIFANDTLSKAFYGNPFFVDQPKFLLRYLFTNGIETWNVSIYQNRITLSNFEDDEILYATERWADNIGCFT